MEKQTGMNRRGFVANCAAGLSLAAIPSSVHAAIAHAPDTITPAMQVLADEMAIQLERRQRFGEECGKLMAHQIAKGKVWDAKRWEVRMAMSKATDQLFAAIFRIDELVELVLPIRSVNPADIAFQKRVLKIKEDWPAMIWTSSYYRERERIEAL